MNHSFLEYFHTVIILLKMENMLLLLFSYQHLEL
nr:MAG TPA: hypothetical protein [Bacteriophage sp.]